MLSDLAKRRRYDPRMTFLIAFIVPMIIGFWAQHRVKSTFARNLQVPTANGLTGAEVARRVLDANGLQDVPIEETPGSLSDHYDPRNRSVHLSPEVYGGRSVASTAVGAHEVGHAIQHAQSYAFFKFRSAMFPAVSFASRIWVLFLIGGIFLSHHPASSSSRSPCTRSPCFSSSSRCLSSSMRRDARRDSSRISASWPRTRRRESRASSRQPPGRTSPVHSPPLRCSCTTCRCSRAGSCGWGSR